VHEAALQEMKEKLFAKKYERGGMSGYPLEIVIALPDSSPLVTPTALQRVSRGLRFAAQVI
jgi:hypothetical protein